MNITINLNRDFTELSFPAGEKHVKFKHLDKLYGKSLDKISLYASRLKDEDLNDFIFRTLLATNVLKGYCPHVNLVIPYLPYARQDRKTSLVEPFSLKVFGDILNTQNYGKVFTFDVHSDVAFGCIDNLHSLDQSLIFDEKLREIGKNKVLVIPDQGAYKRLSGIAGKYAYGFQDSVIAIKKRNTDTGHLEIKQVVGDVVGKDCLIIDDICDGGMTFILLAKELYALGANSVELMVTHGIFSKGLDVLKNARINKVYTTNSFEQVQDPLLEVKDIYQLVIDNI